MIYVDDLFGLENYAALKVALQGSGIQIVEDKSYPLGVKDLAPVLRSIKDKNPDAFVGLTYPPDTILASRQARRSASTRSSSTPASAPRSSSTAT